MAEITYTKTYGALVSNTGAVFTIRNVRGDEFVFAVPTAIDEANFMLDDTDATQIGMVVEVTHEGDYYAGITAVTARLTGALDPTGDTPTMYIGEIADLSSSVTDETTTYTISLLLLNGTIIELTCEDYSTHFPEAQPYVGAWVQVTLVDDAEDGYNTTVVVPNFYLPSGENQVISHVLKVNDADFPKLKEDGEYVYPADWNSLVQAVKLLNANAVALAEVVQQHNMLDNATSQYATKTILENSVATQHIINGAVTELKIKDDAISGAKIKPKHIQAYHIHDGVLGALCSNQLVRLNSLSVNEAIEPGASCYKEFDLGAKYNVVILTVKGYTTRRGTITLTTKEPNVCWISGWVENTGYGTSGPYTCSVVDNKVITPLQSQKRYNFETDYYPLLMTAFGGYNIGLMACHLKESPTGNTIVCMHFERTAQTGDRPSAVNFTAQVHAL